MSKVRLATAEEIAKVYDLRLSYVYRLASLHQWRRIRHGGRAYYDLSEADPILGDLPSVKSKALLTLL